MRAEMGRSLADRLRNKRHANLLWLYLFEKGKLKEIDYSEVKLERLTEELMINPTFCGQITELIDNFVTGHSTQIFDRISDRKFIFIKKALYSTYSYKEIKKPPNIYNGEFALALLDLIPWPHRKKQELMSKIEEKWNDNTKHDGMFDWFLKGDFHAKLEFTARKLIKRNIDPISLERCRTTDNVKSIFDSIFPKVADRLDFINSIKRSYTQQLSKKNKETAIKNSGLNFININVKIPCNQHRKLETIKEFLQTTQPDAICEIIDFYYINNIHITPKLEI